MIILSISNKIEKKILIKKIKSEEIEKMKIKKNDFILFYM